MFSNWPAEWVAQQLIDTTEFVKRVRSIEKRCGGNVHLRRAELAQVRADYMTARIAAKLRQMREFSDLSEGELNAAVDSILAKAGFAATLAPENQKRTAHEEKLVASAKVCWHKLVKGEGLAPTRPWSRATTPAPKRKKIRRQISTAQDNPEVTRETFRRYVAKQALHLLNACEEARTLDESAVPPRIEQIVAVLYSLCISPDTATRSDGEQK